MTLVSIIVASYNKEKYIEETIASVVSQQYTGWELIVVDDASTDNTCSLVRGYTDARIRIIENRENKGANYCRNTGIQLAKGSYIIFLDADDLLLPSCVGTRVAKMQETKGDLCVFAMGTFYKQVGDSTSVWKPLSKDPLSGFLRHQLPWSILQPIWKKDFLQTIGGFDESFERMQDVELHTRALFRHDLSYSLFPEILDCYYRIDEQRKNFNAFTFLRRWVHSSVKYYTKYLGLAREKGYSSYVAGTLYQTNLQLLYYYKQRHISKNEFRELSEELCSPLIRQQWSAKTKLIFWLSGIYNRMRVRIPGINRALTELLYL